jgi:hypothetical protein
MLAVGVDGVVVVVMGVALVCAVVVMGVPVVMVPVVGSSRGRGWRAPAAARAPRSPGVPVFDVMHVSFHSLMKDQWALGLNGCEKRVRCTGRDIPLH